MKKFKPTLYMTTFYNGYGTSVALIVNKRGKYIEDTAETYWIKSDSMIEHPEERQNNGEWFDVDPAQAPAGYTLELKKK